MLHHLLFRRRKSGRISITEKVLRAEIQTCRGSKKHFTAFKTRTELTKCHLLIHIIEATKLAPQGFLERSGQKVQFGLTCSDIRQSCQRNVVSTGNGLTVLFT